MVRAHTEHKATTVEMWTEVAQVHDRPAPSGGNKTYLSRKSEKSSSVIVAQKSLCGLFAWLCVVEVFFNDHGLFHGINELEEPMKKSVMLYSRFNCLGK